MDEPVAHAPQEDRAPIVLRWLFRTVIAAPITFVVFGILSGFGDGLWWKALLLGAVISAVALAEDERRERRDGAALES
jgi:hypothetical protein